MLYNYKGYGLSIGTLIAGYDKLGPGLYYVDNDGTRLTSDYFSCGSGSPYAYSILDSEYKYDMTKEEAIDLGRKAIYHATYRDAASGGINNRKSYIYLKKPISLFSLFPWTGWLDFPWSHRRLGIARKVQTKDKLIPCSLVFANKVYLI